MHKESPFRVYTRKGSFYFYNAGEDYTIGKILQRLYQLTGDISLDHLAEICHLSPNYLSSLFKKEVGISISEFIQQLRIDEAKKLLDLTNYSISEIGTFLNFNDQSYFIKTFKKHTGLTPKQYRGRDRGTGSLSQL